MTEPAQKPPAVTRIARRRALPGHEEEYEADVREMFTLMKKHPGFCAAELIPPADTGGDYQVVVNWESEAQLADWDNSDDRHDILHRMKAHAEGEPEHRRLSGLEAWFEGPVVPASMKPPRGRMAVVTWMGIWPLASLFIYFLTPIWNRIGLPFLLGTAINVALIVLCMTWIVAPRLTRWMQWWLVPKKKGEPKQA